ncbi:SMI1/KNR4 family protein [bacterium]|nr:SMI1/KNR4 family protein [bacterium]
MKEILTLISEGEKHISKKRWSEAVDCYEKLFELEKNLKGIYNLALAYEKTENIEQAEKYYNMFLELKWDLEYTPNWEEDAQYRDISMFFIEKKQNPQKAKEIIDRYLKIDGYDPYLNFVFAKLYFALDDFQKGIQYLKEAYTQNPKASWGRELYKEYKDFLTSKEDSYENHFEAGLKLYKKNSGEKALKEFLKALLIKESHQLYRVIADTHYYKLNSIEQAEKYYNLAVEFADKEQIISGKKDSELDYDFGTTYNNSAWFFYKEIKNYEKAGKYIEKALKIDENNQHYLDSAIKIYFALNSFDKSFKYLENIWRNSEINSIISEKTGFGGRLFEFFEKYSDVAEAYIKDLVEKIENFYKKNYPNYYESHIFSSVTESDIVEFEKKINSKLPLDYRVFLKNSKIQFHTENNYNILPLKPIKNQKNYIEGSIENSWSMMGSHLDNAVFDDGRVEDHIKRKFGNWKSDYIEKVWWSKKWIPFAEDSCGNMLCIDLKPGKNGHIYQIVSMEIQDAQGPFYNGEFRSFADFLKKHYENLLNNRVEFE